MASNFIKSSSLIIARKLPQLQKSENKLFDYDILCLTKNFKGKSLAGQLVFPGGTESIADSNVDGWRAVFDRVKQRTSNVSAYRNLLSGKLTAEDSSKICAIRETFEESGVLLCMPVNHFEGNIVDRFGTSVCELGENGSYWQSEVQKDASKFIELCLKFKVVPLLSALIKVNCWKTPAVMIKSSYTANKRFESNFYFVEINNTAEVKIDNEEICQYKWYKPFEPLEDLKVGKLSMLPPQQYNLSLFSQFPSLSCLTEFIEKHELCSSCSVPYLPQIIRCSDGLILALPGDALYDNELDENCVQRTLDLKIDQTRKESDKLNRFENINGLLTLNCNFRLHGFTGINL